MFVSELNCGLVNFNSMVLTNEILLLNNVHDLFIVFISLIYRDHSDLHGRIEELEITNKRLLEDNTKLKQHVSLWSIFALLFSQTS